MDKDNCGMHWADDSTIQHLIHIIIKDEEVNAAFKRCLDISNDRIEIDNPHSVEKRVPDVWELSITQWNGNGKEFNPLAFLYPNLHKDFFICRDLRKSHMRN